MLRSIFDTNLDLNNVLDNFDCVHNIQKDDKIRLNIKKTDKLKLL